VAELAPGGAVIALNGTQRLLPRKLQAATSNFAPLSSRPNI